jgi:membrane-associated phospholipid phosphatase
MSSNTFTSVARLALAAATLFVVSACSESTTSPAPSGSPSASAVKFWEAGSSVAWNQTARDLIASRSVAAVATQSRILAYLSVAQYNAIVTAETAKDGRSHPSPAAAAAGASLVVLKSFFPLDWTMLDGQLAAQRSAEGWPGEQTKDFAAGEAIGRTIAAEVLAYAATDRVGLTVPPPNPGGPGNWKGTNPVRAHYGARTFALTSGDQFRPAPPPAFGSAEFTAALAEIRAMSDGLTPEQLAIAQLWAPRGPAYMNGVAADMIVAHHRTEREAARVLALANMASFDVLNACFDAKFAYWYIRPSQADPMIKLPVGLPNHPSYPSGHSCITSAYATVLADAFPEESDLLEAMVVEAGLSRNYGGLHYRFDCLAGQQLGRDVAGQVLRTAPVGHNPIPLD